MPDKIGPSGNGLRELILKLTYPFMTLRQDQIEQYMHPDRDVLSKTNERPSSLTSNQYDWRSERKNYPSLLELPSSIAGRKVTDASYPLKIPTDVDPDTGFPTGQAIKTVGINSGNGLMFDQNTDIGRRLGLGTATRSIGFDPKGKPYLSVYDSWDFKGDPASEAITSGGTPFNVYDRIPFDLEDGKFPETIYSGQGHDIELPSESGIGPSNKLLRKIR